MTFLRRLSSSRGTLLQDLKNVPGRMLLQKNIPHLNPVYFQGSLERYIPYLLDLIFRQRPPKSRTFIRYLMQFLLLQHAFALQTDPVGTLPNTGVNGHVFR